LAARAPAPVNAAGSLCTTTGAHAQHVESRRLAEGCACGRA
jgi:hypothetical protein